MLVEKSMSRGSLEKLGKFGASLKNSRYSGLNVNYPGTFLSAHLCCQTSMGLLFLSALLAKPCSHRDNEGLICLQQYGAFLHNLHVFFKAQTLSNEVTNSGAGSCY